MGFFESFLYSKLVDFVLSFIKPFLFKYCNIWYAKYKEKYTNIIYVPKGTKIRTFDDKDFAVSDYIFLKKTKIFRLPIGSNIITKTGQTIYYSPPVKQNIQ